jgi:general secretion pathway protein J
VRVSDLRRQPALLIENDTLELTRAGYANRLAQARAELERVQWSLDDEALVRWRHPVLDRSGSARPEEHARLENVSAWRVEALSLDGRWVARWPEPGEAEEALPRALRVRFDVEGFGRIERVLELADPVSP